MSFSIVSLFVTGGCRVQEALCGNLSFTTAEEELKTLFAQFGEVKSVAIIKDRDTGRSRGFGFVEMENPEAAVAGTNGKRFRRPHAHR